MNEPVKAQRVDLQTYVLLFDAILVWLRLFAVLLQCENHNQDDCNSDGEQSACQ